MKVNPQLQRHVLFWSILMAFLVLQLLLLNIVLRGAGIGFPCLHGARKIGQYFALLIGCALLLRVFPARFRSTSMKKAAMSVLEKWWEFPLILVAYVLLAQAYMWGKVFVPVINPRLWDLQLARLDRLLFAGINPNVLVMTILEGAPRWIPPIIDLFYGAFVPMMLGVTAFFVTDRPAARKGFLTAMAILWSLGLWIYIALPTLGPAFVDQCFGKELTLLFPVAAEMQGILIRQYTQIPQILQGIEIQLSPTFGVAAMPSLHVGAQALFFFWLHKKRSAWRIVFFVIALLTWIASVATGWHWAIDGIIGGLLALFAAWAGWRLIPSADGESLPGGDSGFFSDGDQAQAGPGPESVDGP